MTTNAVMTYDSLVADIQTYAERNDAPFVNQIPRFIMLAENRIASEIRGLGLVKVVSSRFEGNVIKKPARWRENVNMIALVNSKTVIMKERTYEYCRVFAPDASVTGVPRFYADYGYEHWFIAPTPSSDYQFEASYFERPEPLSSINQTNWTTQYAPQLILYAALLEAQPFLKNDDRVATFQGFYTGAGTAVTNEAKRRAFDRSSGVRE